MGKSFFVWGQTNIKINNTTYRLNGPMMDQDIEMKILGKTVGKRRGKIVQQP